jgi:hypothetical protein
MDVPMSIKLINCVKKLLKKLNSPYAFGPKPRGIMACVTKPIAKPIRFANNLAAYRLFSEVEVIGVF